MRSLVTTFYLEMTDAAQLRRPRHAVAGFEVRRITVACPELNRFFYTAVGGDWYWIDRLPWSYDQWLAIIGRPGYETWVAYSEGTPAGYFELDDRPTTGVEITYFGLLPQFVGRGLGGHLLTAAIERAWQRRPPRVWVHTCTLDHPSALANYQARGFRLYKEEQHEENLPEQRPGPWPGANRQFASGPPT
jgi:ribosomal protein S18 acetylase RimI-like enzyme